MGDDTPEKLLQTLVYCFGLHFALRSGKEHRNIRPDMLKVIESHVSRPYLLYTESGSKNHSGGLNQRKVSNKVVKAFANTEDPSRCIVALYRKYMALRPHGNAFYLQPLKQPRKDCWYQSRPMGHTNHSLRRTCATRLYQNGADEQQIMAITGHQSKDGVRTYKKISRKQEEKMNDMVIHPNKKLRQIYRMSHARRVFHPKLL